MVCHYLTAIYPSAFVVFIWWRYLNDDPLDGVTEAGLLGLSKNENQFKYSCKRSSSCTKKNHVCADETETNLVLFLYLSYIEVQDYL